MEVIGLERNKENYSYIVNLGMLIRKDRLYNILNRLDVFEKLLIISVNLIVLFLIGFVFKFVLISELRFGLSRVQYMLMLLEIIGLSFVGSVGLLLFLLFELIEMIIKLIFISDELGENFIKSIFVRSQLLESIVFERNIKIGLDGQLLFSGLLVGLFGRDFVRFLLNGFSFVDFLDILWLYIFINIVINFVNFQVLMVSVFGL